MEAQTNMQNPARRVPIERLAQTFQRFTAIEGLSGILLIISAAVALIWANSPWADLYDQVLQQHLTIGIDGILTISAPVAVWINDALMSIFFFVVGLEIKREVLVGELSTLRRAVLPFIAAMGGMVVPALIYLLFNAGSEGQRGWGIPMATDIAFSLGVLALLGSRVPVSIKIFLTALAIVDDLGAVLVIAFFYTDQLLWLSLLAGLLLLGVLTVYNFAGGRNLVVYTLVSVFIWVAFYYSGVHATVAGVLIAFTIPVRTRIDADQFLSWGRSLLDWFDRSGKHGDDIFLNAQQRSAVFQLEKACEHVETPLHRLEYMLHPWVAFVIMPIFALANAGVSLSTETLSRIGHPVSLGIIFGLLFGKVIGISVFTLLAVRFKLASLPKQTTWHHIFGVGMLGGMGFTMSLFVADLAFGVGHGVELAKMASPAQLIGTEAIHDIATLGILLATIISGTAGFIILRLLPPLEELNTNSDS